MNDTQRKLALEILDEVIKISEEGAYDVRVYFHGLKLKTKMTVEWNFLSDPAQNYRAILSQPKTSHLVEVLKKLTELREG